MLIIDYYCALRGGGRDLQGSPSGPNQAAPERLPESEVHYLIPGISVPITRPTPELTSN